MGERLPSEGERAAASRFFDYSFNAAAAVNPAEVNPIDAAAFGANFYDKYKALMPYDSALLKTWGINEHGRFFNRNDYSIKGDKPQPNRELQQTVMLGLTGPRESEDSVSWQVKMSDNIDRKTGRRNRLHCLFQRHTGEWFGITRHYDSQGREFRTETLDGRAAADLYVAVRYLLKRSGVVTQAKALRKYRKTVAPKIVELESPKRNGLPVTAAEIQQLGELKRIGFPPVPWRQTAPPAGLQ